MLFSRAPLASKEGDRNGLVDGVTFELLDCSDWGLVTPGLAADDENLEGNVPARVLRAELCCISAVMKSGNPSWVGDSGIVSLRGVEPPLAGGPHSDGVKPSWA